MPEQNNNTSGNRRNQKVYRAIMDLSLHESPVDVWTVTEQLARQGDLEDVGGPGYVTELSSRVASSANIEYHARIIAQKSLARQLISFAGNIETKAFDETIDVDDLMQEAEGSLFELAPLSRMPLTSSRRPLPTRTA